MIYCSSLVNGDLPPGERQFGRSWQEALGELRGVKIPVVAGRVGCIENLTGDDCSELHESASVHIFAFMPGEYLLRVQVSAAEGLVWAVRFHTNKRVSRWIGQQASDQATTTFSKSNHSIQLLQGSCKYSLDGRDWVCKQLRVVYGQLPDTSTEYSEMAVTPSGTLCVFPEQGDAVKRVMLDAASLVPIQAVVVSFDREAISIRCLSRSQLSRYSAFADLLRVNARDHWLILAPDERVVAVSIRYKVSRMIAIQLSTDKRKSQWIGQVASKGDTIKSVDCQDQPEGTSIVGFLSTEDAANFRVICFTPSTAS